MKLTELIDFPKGIISIIGGGGKTTLMHTLAKELSLTGTVIITTSTHIRPSDIFPNFQNPNANELKALLPIHPVICIGGALENGKLCAPDISFAELVKYADYCIVEADGAKGLPLKGHASYEPVIPQDSKLTVLVVGADGFGRPIQEVCHRPQIYLQECTDTLRAGWKNLQCGPLFESSPVTPAMEAAVIRREAYGDLVFVNKCETDQDYENAKELSELLSCSVYAGSLQKGVYRCL